MAAPHGYEYITGEVKIERDMAILFFDGARDVWLPKSQIEEPEEFEIGKTIEILIPIWLCEEKELI